MKEKMRAEEVIDILVVEDEPTAATYFEDVLKEDGYIIKRTRLGREAISIVEKNRPRIILLDILLPDIDGIEVLKEIRKTDKEVIIFVISAHLYFIKEIDKYNLDIYAELSKPIPSSDLRRYVREALSSAKK